LCSPLADSTSTFVAGSAAVISRVASTPDVLPRLRSMRTTSGCTVRAIRTAASASGAVARTSKPCSVRSRATPSRHIGWSSTTITETRGSSLISHPSVSAP
jgi:hypothetical protein